MRQSISLSFIRAAKSQETEELFVFLVDIEHSELPSPILVNNIDTYVVSNGKTYLPCFITAEICDDDPTRPPQARLIISNIDRRMVAALRNTSEPCLVTLTVVRYSAPDYIEIRESGLEMRGVTITAESISGTLYPKKINFRPVVDYYFGPAHFSGLFK